MHWPAKVLRRFSKLRFKALNLATIKDIPTDRFESIAATLVSDGWKKTYEYKGFDAWIDYGCVKLTKGWSRLKLEWDNYTEGSIEGPKEIIEGLSVRFALPVVYEWRWSEYDDSLSA